MSGLVFDVSEMLGRPGASRAIRRAAAIPDLRGALGFIGDAEAVHLDLVADAVSDGIVLTGTLSGTMHLSCSRCLVSFDRELFTPVDEVFRPLGANLGAEDVDGYEVSDEHIDLEPMVRDLIVLAIPTQPLHDEACLGLCSTCGADRNIAECGHTQKMDDLRWAPLEALGRMERSS